MIFERIKKIAYNYKEVSFLSNLIEEKRIAILKPLLKMKDNETALMTVHNTMKDYFEHFRILGIKKSTADLLELPKDIVIIHKPLAMIHIPTSHKEYLKVVGPKTRNMIKKAEKQGYEFLEFEWNEHMDEIYDINTSKKVRSAGEMRGWYNKPVQPLNLSEKERYYQKYYGVFKDDRLWAYSTLPLCGNFAFFKYFIGHAEHLKYGIMNYLLSSIVNDFIENTHIEWLNYGWVSPNESSNISVTGFKKHTGFKAYATFFDIEDEIDLLKYSKRLWMKKL